LDPLRRAAPYLAFAYVRFVGASSTLRIDGLEHRASVSRGGRPFIYAFWHQRQLPLTYTHRGRDISILVSRSRDGEIIAEAMRLFGLGAVRGSSSRGAAPAVLEMLSELRSGRCVGISPDGPKGPAREVKPGVIFLAAKSGLPILPITAACGRAWHAERSWDRFLVPLPFGRMCLHHGRPVSVAEGDDEAAKAAELKAELDRITLEADRWAR
jgi:lysophospholipid acyltransferase (LPLAT)-like uncharacterized protein